jgi:hypothetical protein
LEKEMAARGYLVFRGQGVLSGDEQVPIPMLCPAPFRPPSPGCLTLGVCVHAYLCGSVPACACLAVRQVHASELFGGRQIHSTHGVHPKAPNRHEYSQRNNPPPPAPHGPCNSRILSNAPHHHIGPHACSEPRAIMTTVRVRMPACVRARSNLSYSAWLCHRHIFRLSNDQEHGILGVGPV